MHCVNNAVVMQTEQLGQIEVLEEELHSSRARMVEMEQKVMEQDRVITQLVGDNLEHLQDNMQLTAHINSSNKRLSQMALGARGPGTSDYMLRTLRALVE